MGAVRMGHGGADRLLVDDFDVERFDQLVDGGGDDAEAIRLVGSNRFLGPNRFGRLFPDRVKFRPPDQALTDLGMAMRETAPTDPALNNSTIPSGFTYFGQFVDHDITFDQTSGFPLINDPDEIASARTPTLDLDSLYGLGPVRQPELYDPSFPADRARFLLGLTSSVASGGGIGQPDVPTGLPNDLPRRADRSAIIGDRRNDENLLIAQTHLAMLKFHNRVMDVAVAGTEGDDEAARGAKAKARYTQAEEDRSKTAFHRARRMVRWHYQWIVLHDFLPRLVEPSVLADVLEHGRKFYDFKKKPFRGEPFMPLEFSVAAYRFGHSMIRQSYNHNRVFNAGGPPALTDGSLSLLFAFTGGGGFLPPNTHSSLPSNWIVDFRRFFDLGRADLINFTRKIDTKIVPQLHTLPVPSVVGGPPASLPVRNLLRGSRVGLPSGQDTAKAMNLTPLTAAQVAGGDDAAILQQHGLDRSTPLWYYLLKEAEVEGGGNHLGQVGSRILSEVFVGMLEGDKNSFLSKKKNWTPTLPAAVPGTFTMADLLRFVDDINPLGPGPEGP